MEQALNHEILVRQAAATPRGLAVLGDFYAARASGAEIWDVEGRRFIDFGGGYAVMNVGHGHPRVLAAVREQLERFTHTSFQAVPYESYVSLAEKLNQLTPGTHAKKTALFSTGAEAVENAIKIARAHTGRSGVIAFGGGFHGRSLLALALTGKVAGYKAGFGPFPPEVFHLPFPAEGADLAATRRALERLFLCDIEASRVAAMIFEPVQGEGGFNVIQPEAVAWMREVCDEHGIVLIADEIQTGFGRTGRLFAMERHLEHSGTVADLVLLAKSLAAGLPLSAVTGRAGIMDAPARGGLGGTYAGNPLAVAAAHAVIDIMQEEELPARGAALGQRLRALLQGERHGLPQIADVRGPGAMVAVEFRHPDSGAADAGFARRVQEEALKRGLLLLGCGMEANVIRFLFPLTIPELVFEEALVILQDSLRIA